MNHDAHPSHTLATLPANQVAIIRSFISSPQHKDETDLKRRLMELGFVPGERVQVLRRALFGRGPLAVRVGTSTFALRTHESSLIEVMPA